VKYRSSGHSGYAEAGSDIVCATLSALLQSPLGGMQDVLGLRPGFQQDVQKGLLEVDLTQIPSEQRRNKSREINALLETMVEMVRALAKQYPKNVKLVEKEEK